MFSLEYYEPNLPAYVIIIIVVMRKNNYLKVNVAIIEGEIQLQRLIKTYLGSQFKFGVPSTE